jgi:hypothetical protein
VVRGVVFGEEWERCDLNLLLDAQVCQVYVYACRCLRVSPCLHASLKRSKEGGGGKETPTQLTLVLDLWQLDVDSRLVLGAQVCEVDELGVMCTSVLDGQASLVGQLHLGVGGGGGEGVGGEQLQQQCK